MGTPGGEGSPTDLGHLDSSTSGNLPDSPDLLHRLCRHTWGGHFLSLAFDF